MANQTERTELHKTIWKIANDCNLSVSSYVEQEDTREVINITEVNAKLETLIAEGNELNEKIEAIIKELGA